MKPGTLTRHAPDRRGSAATGVAVALTAGLVATGPGHLRGILALLGAIGALCILAAASLRTGGPVLPGLLALGGAFVLLDGLGDLAAVTAVPYALGLLVVAELAYDAAASRRGVAGGAPGGRRDVRRIAHLGLVGVGSLAACFGILAVASEGRGGAPVEIAGLVAVVALLGLVALVAVGPRRK